MNFDMTYLKDAMVFQCCVFFILAASTKSNLQTEIQNESNNISDRSILFLKIDRFTRSRSDRRQSFKS